MSEALVSGPQTLSHTLHAMRDDSDTFIHACALTAQRPHPRRAHSHRTTAQSTDTVAHTDHSNRRWDTTHKHHTHNTTAPPTSAKSEPKVTTENCASRNWRKPKLLPTRQLSRTSVRLRLRGPVPNYQSVRFLYIWLRQSFAQATCYGTNLFVLNSQDCDRYSDNCTRS